MAFNMNSHNFKTHNRTVFFQHPKLGFHTTLNAGFGDWQMSRLPGFSSSFKFGLKT